MAKPAVDVVADDYPMIIEFNNMQDNTTQVHSTVDNDEPLFQPSPKVVVFEDYAPFAIHEKKLFFRNNDSVSFTLLFLFSSRKTRYDYSIFHAIYDAYTLSLTLWCIHLYTNFYTKNIKGCKKNKIIPA